MRSDKAINKLKDALVVSEFGHLPSQTGDKAITDPGTVRLPAVTPDKRASSTGGRGGGGSYSKSCLIWTAKSRIDR